MSDSDAKDKPNRRVFLKMLGQAAAVSMLASCSERDREAFFQQHFKELSKADLAKVLERLQAEATEKTISQAHPEGRAASIGVEPAMPGVTFGYALDLSRCVGCRRCVDACVKENNQSRDPQIHWITVLEMEKEGGVDVMHSNAYYVADTVPRKGHFYMPVSCQQCRDAPCVKSCPVGATWQEPDGIVVVDYNYCIGCRCCLASCPYGARHFNWAEPHIPPDEINTNMHYLGNRPRPKGVVEKCTFCIQRVRKGLYPACVEICPTGSRKFGNLLDPDSEVRYVIENKRVFILKEELGTHPKFFYFYGV
ncbi:MAG: 4Fe-4S dicluster domain-containing protein [Deltaproteobacteria bacterium]|nr:4Fe-4S dicluster domain-containing protein [Deltaproteobacteria bacterium]